MNDEIQFSLFIYSVQLIEAFYHYHDQLLMTDFLSSPEYAAFQARNAAAAVETSAPGGPKVQAGKRKKASPVTEAVSVAKAASGKKAKTTVSSAIKEETGKARKIRDKGRKNNPLDNIPSSNVPPMSEEENKECHFQVREFTDNFMTVLNAVAKEIREAEALRQLEGQVAVEGDNVILIPVEEYDFSGLDLSPFENFTQ
jgi:hypothetical protein